MVQLSKLALEGEEGLDASNQLTLLIPEIVNRLCRGNKIQIMENEAFESSKIQFLESDNQQGL